MGTNHFFRYCHARFCFLVIFVMPAVAMAQNLTLGKQYNIMVDRQLNRLDCQAFTTFKPYSEQQLSVYIDLDSLYGSHQKFYWKRRQTSYLIRKLRYEHLVEIDTGEFRLTIDPLFQFEGGRELKADQSTALNTRGVRLTGQIGERLTFYSQFYENQGQFPDFLTAYINQQKIVPGQGYVKALDANRYDYNHSEAAFNVQLADWFEVQAGHGKHFIGDGYRSLLLSDNSFSYPFLQLTSQIWKIKYINLYTAFSNIDGYRSGAGAFQKKYGSFHVLLVQPCKRWEVGLFEGILWEAGDSLYHRGFDVNYLNPVIFFRPVEFALGSPDNAIIGLTNKLKLNDNNQLYSQFVLDDINISESRSGSGFFQNKYGFQVGGRAFDLFRLKGLYFQAEYNQVQPYTYAHKIEMQAYTHYRQPLAHPQQANFRELCGELYYRHNNASIGCRVLYAEYGADTANTHWGHDIFRSDLEAQFGPFSLGNELLQGETTSLFQVQITADYYLNYHTNLKLYAAILYRRKATDMQQSASQWLFFGISTSLSNYYYDF